MTKSFVPCEKCFFVYLYHISSIEKTIHLGNHMEYLILCRNQSACFLLLSVFTVYYMQNVDLFISVSKLFKIHMHFSADCFFSTILKTNKKRINWVNFFDTRTWWCLPVITICILFILFLCLVGDVSVEGKNMEWLFGKWNCIFLIAYCTPTSATLNSIKWT